MKNTHFSDSELNPASVSGREPGNQAAGVEATVALWNALLARETEAIGRELHDDLGQVLTALRMNISLFKLQHPDEPILQHKADDMLVIADRGMLALCKLIDVLRPLDLGEGLTPALESFCRRFCQYHQLSFTLAISAECDCLDEGQTLVLFRVLREALANIARHAVPCTASISLTRTAGAGLCVEISDNGCGFETAEAERNKGLGLPLMRACTAALGGRMELRSELSVGTVITLRIPVE